MKFKKPKFWDLKKPNIISILFFPLTIIIFINNLLLNQSKKAKNKYIKSICVGNIYLGGTGKTPLVIKLHKIFNKLNYKICVGKKFYKDQKDEQILLNDETNLIIETNRKKIFEKAIFNKNNLIIFDDGLQDKTVNYNIKLVCFDQDNWIGNGLLIPSGPLRENLNSLKKYDAIIIKKIEEIGNMNEILDDIKKINPKIKIFYSQFYPMNLNNFDLSKKYLIFSGIGNHNSFRNLLLINNFDIIEEMKFPDHFNYKQKDLDKIINKAISLGAEIITTEKDFSKISKLEYENIKFLKIDLKIENEIKFINFMEEKINE